MLLSVGSVEPMVGIFTLEGRGVNRRFVRVNGVQEPQYERTFLIETIFLVKCVWYGLTFEEMHLNITR